MKFKNQKPPTIQMEIEMNEFVLIKAKRWLEWWEI